MDFHTASPIQMYLCPLGSHPEGQYMMCDLLFITQPLLLRPQGSEVPRPLLRAELGEADPRPCWAPGIACRHDPVGLTVAEPEPALRHNTFPPISCFKIQPASVAQCHVRIAGVHGCVDKAHRVQVRVARPLGPPCPRQLLLRPLPSWTTSLLLRLGLVALGPERCYCEIPQTAQN